MFGIEYPTQFKTPGPGIGAGAEGYDAPRACCQTPTGQWSEI